MQSIGKFQRCRQSRPASHRIHCSLCQIFFEWLAQIDNFPNEYLLDRGLGLVAKGTDCTVCYWQSHPVEPIAIPMNLSGRTLNISQQFPKQCFNFYNKWHSHWNFISPCITHTHTHTYTHIHVYTHHSSISWMTPFNLIELVCGIWAWRS